MQYLDNPSDKHDRRTRVYASNYVLYRNELYQKGEDYCASVHMRLLKQLQKYTKEFAELINLDGRCVGCFVDTAISGRLC